MVRLGLLLSILLFVSSVGAQTRIDSTLTYKKKSKQFSVYIPSGAKEGSLRPMFLALHPFNPKRWNAAAWCDTLMAFAEREQVVLLCPDGGPDGKVDDPIDTAFTSKLLAGAASWLPVDRQRTYLIGFSWGGRTTYSYGLQHPTDFRGYIAIGAAFSNTNDYPPGFANADDKPFFLLHGENDHPDIRLFPLCDSLQQFGAYVNQRLIPGVGHTIDFANRDEYLSAAYHWVDSVATDLSDTNQLTAKLSSGIQSEFPEKVKGGSVIEIDYVFRQQGEFTYVITDLSGKPLATRTMKVGKGRRQFNVSTEDLPWGVYLIQLVSPKKHETFKFMVRG